jgi:hypothetical protein
MSPPQPAMQAAWPREHEASQLGMQFAPCWQATLSVCSGCGGGPLGLQPASASVTRSMSVITIDLPRE